MTPASPAYVVFEPLLDDAILEGRTLPGTGTRAGWTDTSFVSVIWSRADGFPRRTRTTTRASPVNCPTGLSIQPTPG